MRLTRFPSRRHSERTTALTVLLILAVSAVPLTISVPNRVYAYSPLGTLISHISIGLNPWGAVYDSNDGYVFVTSSHNGGTITVIDASTMTITHEIQDLPGGNAQGIAYDPVNGYIYVAEQSLCKVAIYSASMFYRVTTIDTCALENLQPSGTFYNPAGNNVYISYMGVCGGGCTYPHVGFTIISGTSVSGSISLRTASGQACDGESAAWQPAYSPLTQEVYVNQYCEPDVAIVNGVTNHVVTHVPTPGAGSSHSGIAYDSDRGYILAPTQTNIYVLDSTNSVVQVISTTDSFYTGGAVYDPVNHLSYFAAQSSIIAVNDSSLTEVGSFEGSAEGIAFDYANQNLYVVCNNGTVSVIHTSGPPEETGNLNVAVTDASTGGSISGASVAMTGAPSGQLLLSGLTGSSGQYIFQNVKSGLYTVQVAAPTYDTGSGSGTVLTGQTETIQVPLVWSLAVYTSDTTLTADVYCVNLRINPGVILTTSGHDIYCTGIFDNEGTINVGRQNNGGARGVGSTVQGGGGGSGAYALYIQAYGIIAGTINANGGNGQSCTTAYCGGGGGGGGGGLLFAYGVGGYSPGMYDLAGGGPGTGVTSTSAGQHYVGGIGGETRTAGGAAAGCNNPPSSPGGTPSAPSLTAGTITSWYGDFNTFLAGGGGGGGAGGGSNGGGGGPMSSSYGGSGGGGGSQCLAASSGGSGRALTYSYGSIPPIAVSFSLSVYSAPVGATVVMSGTGLASLSSISAKFDSGSLTLTGSCSTSSSGVFDGCSFIVPASAPGSHKVTISDGTHSLTAAPFTVGSSISLSPSSGPVFTSVTITGAGLGVSQLVTVTFTDMASVMPTCSTDASGTITPGCTFVVAPTASGSYTVTVHDGVHSPTASFTVVSSLAITPASGTVGSTVSIAGYAFHASSLLAVTYDGSSAGMPACTTDTSGSINSGCVFVVPSSALGPHTVTVSDGTNNPTATFTTNSLLTVNTTLSSSSIAVGGSVADSATLLAATADAGGTITYEYFSGYVCAGTATPVGTPVTVTNGVAPSSIYQTFNSAGPYSWKAVYSGDINNEGRASACERLAVTPRIVSVATTLSHLGILAGQSVYDTAVLKGGYYATGTVTYYLYSGATCAGTATKVGAPVFVTNGIVPRSVSHTFTLVKAYSWKAVYSGDKNNKGPPSPCERMTVLPTSTPPTHTTVSCTKTSFALATRVTCTATVTGGYTVRTGTITWSKASGTGGVTFSSKTCTLIAGRCSVILTATAKGSITIQATYSGDIHNPWSSRIIILTIT